MIWTSVVNQLNILIIYENKVQQTSCLKLSGQSQKSFYVFAYSLFIVFEFQFFFQFFVSHKSRFIHTWPSITV